MLELNEVKPKQDLKDIQKQEVKDDSKPQSSDKLSELSSTKMLIDKKKNELQEMLEKNSLTNNFLELNESAILEYSMEMSRQLGGIMKDNESTLLNETLNNSKIYHRREYSNETSFMFGKEYLNETLNNILTTDQNDKSFDHSDNEINFKQMFESSEGKTEEKKDRKSITNVFIKSPRNKFKQQENPFALSDSGSAVSSSNNRSNSPELGRSAFNPFKSPVVPEAINNSKHNTSQSSNQSKSNRSDGNKSETGEIKIVSDQYSEWNKRITQAMNNDNYYNDSATKPHKRALSNPSNQLNLSNMRDIDAESPEKLDNRRKYLRHTSTKEDEPQNPATNNLNKMHALFVSFNPTEQPPNNDNNNPTNKNDKNQAEEVKTVPNNVSTPIITAKRSKNDKKIKEILSIEIILIMINTDLVSDFEVNRTKRYLKELLEKDPDCSEAHYGLSQVYFSVGLYNRALEEINIALQNNKQD